MATTPEKGQKQTARAGTPPDSGTVNAIQASRLAAMTGLNAKELAGAKVSELSERLKWVLEPHLLLFRRVCGRVVKRDPGTGAEYGVPNATVTVQDTDCGLLAYFPPSSKYGWFYPLGCRRETLATVTTDECGYFCVWIPRWDIDWILRWRKERICFPTIFERPSILDILHDIPILVDPQIPPRPGPGPDPPPDVDPTPIFDRISLLSAAALSQAVGPRLANRLNSLPPVSVFGASTAQASAALTDNAFDVNLPPPLPDEFKRVEHGAEPRKDKRAAHTIDMVRNTLAQRLGIDVERLKDFDIHRPIGPFKRCYTRYIPEWTLVVDVPDITFRVTQDVDGDGDEEVIYSEGFFDVRWNAGAIPPVKLVASGIARESLVCEHPPVVCGNVPDIQFAGMMRLTPPYHDTATGYAIRPNRPKPLPPPLMRPDATAPFCQNVNLFGCLVTTGGATKYRIVYRYSSDNGVAFTPALPLTPVPWYWHPVVGPAVPAVFDGDGWYNMPPAGLIGPEVNFLFPFNTAAYADGLYELTLQVGTGGSSITAPSAAKPLRLDNSAPVYTPSIRWRIGAGPWNTLSYPCPVVPRSAARNPVEFEVKWEVSATHYRDAAVSAGGCGSGNFTFSSTGGFSTASGPNGLSDWHQGPADNGVVFHTFYTLPGTAAQGTYNFGLVANTRAFNPAGADAGYQTNDWFYDSPNGGVWVAPSFFFSVIDA